MSPEHAVKIRVAGETASFGNMLQRQFTVFDLLYSSFEPDLNRILNHGFAVMLLKQPYCPRQAKTGDSWQLPQA